MAINGIKLKASKIQNEFMRLSFLPKSQPKITRIVAPFFGDFLLIVGSFFGYNPCLFGRAEILVMFGWHFGRNDDLINSS